MFNFVVLLLTLAVVSASKPFVPTVSAAIRDTSLEGLEGLNLKIAIPYRFQDYLVGLKYTVGDFRKLPDTLFAVKSFDTPFDGKVKFDTEFSVEDKRLGLNVDWESSALDLSASAAVDSIDKLKKVSLTKKFKLNDFGVKVQSCYNVQKNKFFGSMKVNNDATSVEVSGDSIDMSPVLSVEHKIDAYHTVNPAINLRTGAQTYGVSRRWLGGHASTTLSLGEKVNVEWVDEGSLGDWKTEAEIPLKNGEKPKISFSREWKY